MTEHSQDQQLNFEWIKYDESQNQICYLQNFIENKKLVKLKEKDLSFLNLEELNQFFQQDKHSDESIKPEIKETESSINAESNDKPWQICKDMSIQDMPTKMINEKQQEPIKKNQTVQDVTNNQLRTIVKFGNSGINYKYYSKKKRGNRKKSEEDKNFINDEEEDQGARGLYFFETQYEDYFGFSGTPQGLIESISYQKRIKDLQKIRTLTNDEQKLIIKKSKEMPRKKIKHDNSKKKSIKKKSNSQIQQTQENNSKNKSTNQSVIVKKAKSKIIDSNQSEQIEKNQNVDDGKHSKIKLIVQDTKIENPNIQPKVSKQKKKGKKFKNKKQSSLTKIQ